MQNEHDLTEKQLKALNFISANLSKNGPVYRHDNVYYLAAISDLDLLESLIYKKDEAYTEWREMKNHAECDSEGNLKKVEKLLDFRGIHGIFKRLNIS